MTSAYTPPELQLITMSVNDVVKVSGEIPEDQGKNDGEWT